MAEFSHQQLLEQIVNSTAKQQGDFTKTAELATELLFEHLSLSDVSVWGFSDELHLQFPIARFGDLLIDKTQRTHHISSCPLYLSELKKRLYIASSNASTDSRLQELTQGYFIPKGVESVLDIAIRINGRLEGVLCLEKLDPGYNWTQREIQIASQVSDQLALTLATQNAYAKEEQLTLFRSSAEQSENISMVINAHTEVIEYVNSAHSRITGASKKKVLGNTLSNLDYFKQNPKHSEAALAQVLKGETTKGEVELERFDGRKYWLKFSASSFITERGNHYILMTGEDSTRQRNHQSELERLAWRCNLTGLHNRTHFTRALDRSVEGQLFLVDLVGFKRFNDTYGHEKGDILLMEIARRIKHFTGFKSASEIARVGSDEFAILLDKGANEQELESLANQVYSCIARPVTVGREQVEPKLAIVAVDIASVANLVAPLTCADIALQYAKDKSCRQIQVFNSKLLDAFKQDAQIERDLHSAIRGRQFELYYQPLRDLQSNTYIGAEALIRWHHPKKGVLYPGAFIDIAEQTGMINAIGSWVLEAACRQLNLWQHHNMDLVMHVNVSARQFFSGNLFEQVWQLLIRYRLKPQSLILEITETELMADIRYATNLCQELSELGVGLAIDDFGTGYSSMRYLKQFPISKLKIDRSFVTDLTISHESREIVSAIIAMATALNISLTAEGVETQEQASFLRESQCHHAQGYLYSPALREAEFVEFVFNDVKEAVH